MDTYQFNKIIEQLQIISMQLNQLNGTLLEEVNEDDDTRNEQERTKAKQ